MQRCSNVNELRTQDTSHTGGEIQGAAELDEVRGMAGR
jgi:hypothetical protein